MRQISQIILFIALTLASCSQKRNVINQTEDKYETVDGKRQIVGQIIKTLRQTDSLPIVVITKIFNYEDDVRLKYSTGLSKKDGLQEYLMDSIFYDNKGNDTLKKSFVHRNNNWQPTQVYYKRFREDNKVIYFMTERPFRKDFYFKKETFYMYNDRDDLSVETEIECRQKNICDSTFKKKYVYDMNGKPDSTILYSWRNNNWTEIKRRTASAAAPNNCSAMDLLKLKDKGLQDDFFKQLDSIRKVQYPNNAQDTNNAVDITPNLLRQFLKEVNIDTLQKNGIYECYFFFNIAPPGYTDSKKCKDKIVIQYFSKDCGFRMVIDNVYLVEKGDCTGGSQVVYGFNIVDGKIVDFGRNEAG